LLRQFDEAVNEFTHERPGTDHDHATDATIGRLIAHGPARVGLRVVLIHNAFAGIATARELYRTAKDAARADRETKAARTDSVLIEAGGAAPDARRRSA
jgi:hypothetical protein